MDWQETLYRWEEYSEKLYLLRDEVAYIFETKCFYDDNWEYQERLYESDDDTVFFLRLSGMLNEICEFVKSHIEVLSHRVEVDEEIRGNVEHAFEAWKRGLCPRLMRKVPHYVLSDKNGSGDLYSSLGAYDVCSINAPFTVQKYIDAIKDAENSGYDVLILDSISA